MRRTVALVLALVTLWVAGCAAPRRIGEPGRVGPVAREGVEDTPARAQTAAPDASETRLVVWRDHYRVAFAARGGGVLPPPQTHPSAAHYAYELERARWEAGIPTSVARRHMGTFIAIGFGALVLYGVWTVASIGSSAVED